AVDVLLAVGVVLRWSNLVHLPRRRLVPHLAVEDVELAVLVDVGDGDALGAKRPVEDSLIPGDAGVVGERYFRLLGGNANQGADEADQGSEKPGTMSHGGYLGERSVFGPGIIAGRLPRRKCAVSILSEDRGTVGVVASS